MKLLVLLMSFVCLTLSTASATSTQIEEPYVEIEAKVLSFDEKFVQVEMPDKQHLILPRSAIRHPVVSQKFKKYQLSIQEWKKISTAKSS